MNGERYVDIRKLDAALKGRETEILDQLGIDWRAESTPCPYPHHENDTRINAKYGGWNDDVTGWRWDPQRARAVCTCTNRMRPDNITNVAAKVLRLDSYAHHAALNIWLAEHIGRSDLIQGSVANSTPPAEPPPPSPEPAPKAPAHAAGDSITVLHSLNRKHAAKQFTMLINKKTGEWKIKNRSYGFETDFRVEEVVIESFDDLAAALDRLIDETFAFPIHGGALPGTNLNHTPRWKNPHKGQPATFGGRVRHWFPVDVDKLAAPALTDPAVDPEGAIEWLVGKLPPACHDASCWWSFTSSQSLPKIDPAAPDLLSARLVFWSETPHIDIEFKRWALAWNAANGGRKIIDPCLYDPIQACYIARPSFIGMEDPLPRRHGVRRGLVDTVSLIIPPAHSKRRQDEPGEGYEPGQGVEHWLNLIGKPHFRDPIVKAIASFVGSYGSTADCTKLKEAVCKRIDDADAGGRSDEEIARYKSDTHLDSIVDAIRAFQGTKPGRGFTPEPPSYLDLPPPGEPLGGPRVGDWYSRCLVGVDGRTLSNLSNTLLALLEDPAWRGFFTSNDLLAAALLTRKLPNNRNNGGST